MMEGKVLAGLQGLDGRGQKLVDAGAFQELLESCGVPLGSEVADAIVLQCKIQSDGMVDFSEFERSVENSATRRGPPALVNPSSSGAPTPEKVARPSVRPPLPTPVAQRQQYQEQPQKHQHLSIIPPQEMDPKERVRHSTGKLHEIFSRYDTGKISIQQVHREVIDLGLEETAAFLNLMRSAPLDMTFSQLFQALLQVREPPTLMGQSDSAYGTPSASSQPVSPRARESVNSPWNTPTATHGKAYAQGIYSMPSPMAAGKRTTPEKYRTHIHLQMEPPTKQPSEKEILKEQVYSCIRLLDQGRISTRDFERRLAFLNIQIPNQVARLLAKAQADGSVNFQQFALAFEPLFHPPPKPMPVEMPAPPPIAPISSSNNNNSTSKRQEDGFFRSPTRRVTSRAQTTHGDILTWASDPTKLEVEEVNSLEKGRRCGYSSLDAHRRDQVDLTWSDTPSVTQQQPPQRTYRRPDQITHANILSWDERPAGNSSSNKSGSMSYPFGIEYNQ